LVEAGKAFGCTIGQLCCFKVELPAAMSSIGAGITHASCLSLLNGCYCALVGADGLGYRWFELLDTVEIGKGFLKPVS